MRAWVCARMCAGFINLFIIILKVLYSQLKHHNPSVRHDALVGLRDIFQLHPELLPKNVSKLVEQVFSALVDGSSLVRQATRLLVKTVLSQVTQESVTPFFRILVAHLSCALTHIKEKIQVDSLEVLELYLQYYPTLLVQYAGDILPILIGLLSRQKADPSYSRSSLKKGKSLISILHGTNSSSAALVSNPNSKFTSKSSRLSIFGLILKLLQSLLVAASSSQVNNSSNLLQDKEQLLGFSESLVSILLESWVECCPAGEKCLPKQSLTFLDTVLHMLCVLVKVLVEVATTTEEEKDGRLESRIRELCGKLCRDVSVHIMPRFPFTLPAGSSASSFVMNFTFSETVLLLHKLLRRVGVRDECQLGLAGLRYLSGLSSQDVKNIASSAQELLTCSAVLEHLLPILCEMSHASDVDEELLGKVFAVVKEFYFACHPHSRSKQTLVKCLNGIFVSELAGHGCK